MRKSVNWRWLAASILAMALVFPGLAGAQEVSELRINSTRYIVIDAATGNVFAQRGADEQVAIASVTKVFTAVQALEMAPLDTPITTNDSDLRAPGGEYFGTNGTLMGFGADETYTLEDMLYGMLLPSGNDAANAIARVLGGQPGDSDDEAIQRFLDLLNQRVVDMGLTNTHFTNPHGWGEDGHHSSAADVAAFARLVANYPLLMEIMGTQSYTTSNDALTVTNTNRSLTLYPSVTAGKTGYDWDAGYCLLNFAQRDGSTVIAVTLDGVAPNDWYDDNATLLEYAFEQEEAVRVNGGAFDGDVLEFTDPSAAEIARSAQPDGGFTPIDSTPVGPEPTVSVAATVPPVDPVPTGESPQPVPRTEGDGSGISGPAPWAMTAIAAVVLAVAGWRGWTTLERAGGEHDGTGELPESSVDIGSGDP